MAKLLVSVRSVPEAAAALAGGAALIDVKEPAHGSLGRASDATRAAIIDFIGKRRPISAALGEFLEGTPLPQVRGLSYVKWGLAGCGSCPRWQRALTAAAERLFQIDPSCRLVAVAYADWQRAGAPPPAEVSVFAGTLPCGAFLLDTWRKDGTTLLDWLDVVSICHLGRVCRAAGVPLALAGSLGLAHVPALSLAQPDWFAVRGSVCRDGHRGRALDPAAVKRWVQILEGVVSPATAES